MAEQAARPLNRVVKGWDTLRLPRLGVIQIGEKDENGRPRSLDYFVCPPEVRAVYGDQPKRLDIAFPVEDVSVIFPSQLERYGDQFGRICTGDGERANLSAVYARGQQGQSEYGVVPRGGGFVNAATGAPLPVFKGGGGKEYVQIPCLHRSCPLYKAGKCREVGRLKFLLPKVPGMLGVYQIATSSVNSYLNVAGALALLLKMLVTLRQPVWTVTLQLEVRMEPAHPVIGEGDRQRQVKTTVPALYILKNDMTLEEFVRRATAGALPERPAVALPPGVRVEIEEDNEDEKPELLFPPPEAREEAPEEPAPSGPKPAAPEPAPGTVKATASGPPPAEAREPASGKPAAAGAAQAVRPGASVAGEFEVVSAPAVKKDHRNGEEVVVLRVKTLSVDEDEKLLPAGRAFYAFSGPGLEQVREVMGAAVPGSRLLLEGYRAKNDSLVVRQAMKP